MHPMCRRLTGPLRGNREPRFFQTSAIGVLIAGRPLGRGPCSAAGNEVVRTEGVPGLIEEYKNQHRLSERSNLKRPSKAGKATRSSPKLINRISPTAFCHSQGSSRQPPIYVSIPSRIFQMLVTNHPVFVEEALWWDRVAQRGDVAGLRLLRHILVLFCPERVAGLEFPTTLPLASTCRVEQRRTAHLRLPSDSSAKTTRISEGPFFFFWFHA